MATNQLRQKTNHAIQENYTKPKSDDSKLSSKSEFAKHKLYYNHADKNNDIIYGCPDQLKLDELPRWSTTMASKIPAFVSNLVSDQKIEKVDLIASPIKSCIWWQSSASFSKPLKRISPSPVSKFQSSTNNAALETGINKQESSENGIHLKVIGTLPEHFENATHRNEKKWQATKTLDSNPIEPNQNVERIFPRSYSDSYLKDCTKKLSACKKNQANSSDCKKHFSSRFNESCSFKEYEFLPKTKATMKNRKIEHSNSKKKEHKSDCGVTEWNLKRNKIAPKQTAIFKSDGDYIYLETPLFPEKKAEQAGFGTAIVPFLNTGTNFLRYECFCKVCNKTSINYNSNFERKTTEQGSKQSAKTKQLFLSKNYFKQSRKGFAGTNFIRGSRKSNLLCFRCGDSESESSSSGGSDTENDDDEVSRERVEYTEHGAGGSAEEDSGGGSDSETEDSLDSAELFDNLNLVPESKAEFEDENESDGPDLESDNSDSLTELQAMKCRKERKTDDDEDDDATDDDFDELSDWWETLTIYDE